MNLLRKIGGLTLLIVLHSSGAGAQTTCGGVSTVLYSDNKVILTICHGPYTKIDVSKLGEWQDCDDATIQVRRKEDGKEIEYADCMATTAEQFLVRERYVFINHFFTEYPGYEKKPMLVEAIELDTNKRNYELKGKFLARSKKDFDDAIKQIDSTLKKPFDNDTFFSSVYVSFFILRDYAVIDPKSVLSALKDYQESQRFDGEVAEKLGEVIEEVRLIFDAHQKR